MSADDDLAYVQGVTEIPAADITLPKTLLRLVDKQSVEYLELVESIRTHGLLKPILVRKRNGRWEIIDGLHRFTASVEAGHKLILCREIEATDEEALALMIQANALNKETLPCEYAAALRRYLKFNPDLTLSGLSRIVHKSPAWIANCLSLVQLDEVMQTMVNRGEIPLQSAYLLSRIPKMQRGQFVNRAKVMTAAEFKPLATEAIRQWSEAIRTGRLERYYPDEFTPRSWLRSLRDARQEMKTWEQGHATVNRDGLATPLDGWRAAITWMLHLDSLGVEEQRRLHQSQKRCPM